MSSSIVFDAFNLQDSNYVTTALEYRTIPIRELVAETLSRKPGKKLISEEFMERKIRLTGWILGSDASDLITRIDNLHTNVTRKKIGTLTIDTDRQIEAVAAAVTVQDPHYTQSAVPMEIEFIATEPFFKGSQQTVSLTVASGSASQAFTITISGSVFAEPTITYTAPGSSGSTTTSGIIIEYGPTAETLTWSGGTGTLGYGSNVQFDYANQLILQNSTSVEPTGVFSRWEPGSTSVTATYSGTAQGGTLSFAYRPRYL